MRRRLSSGPGFVTDFISDGSGKVTLHTHADVGPLLEENKRRFDGDRMARRGSDMREVANVDNVTFLRWMREESLTLQQLNDRETMDRFLRKKLNDRDNAFFRTGPEQL